MHLAQTFIVLFCASAQIDRRFRSEILCAEKDMVKQIATTFLVWVIWHQRFLECKKLSEGHGEGRSAWRSLLR